MGDDGDDDDDGGAAAAADADEVDLTAPLEEGELDAVFHVVHADKGFLNTMQFIALLRAIGASAAGQEKRATFPTSKAPLFSTRFG